MSNKKPRSPSVAIKMPPPQPPPAPRIELSRTTKITKIEDGTPREYTVSFDELVAGDLLGRGQFGTVKKMYHPPTDLTFAVKMIMDDLTESSSQIMDLEAPKLIGDGCPHLIKFYGAMHADSYIWILTEVMDTSLDRFYAKMFALPIPIPESLISKIAHAVLSALEHMKARKLMHRDIKPSNILINSTGEIKLCCLGVRNEYTINSVRNSFERCHYNKPSENVGGCSKYTPPERIESSSTDPRCSVKEDIWRLGISLIEIAMGEHPFSKVNGIFPFIVCLTKNDSPRLDPGKFSAEFCSFVDKCLIKNAKDRPNCTDLLAEEFITYDLDEKLESGDISAVIRKLSADD